MNDTQLPIQMMPVTQLQPNPLQPRGDFQKEELEDLKQSIVQHGVIEPLVVAQTPAGYQIIAGERRWRAAKMAGLQQVPVVIRRTTPRGMLEMALIENVQRVDLNPLERAKAFQRLMTEFKLSQAKLAERIGKSTPFVSNSMRLLNLPDAIKDGLLSGSITEGHARALAGIQQPRLMVEAFKILLKENGSVRRAEALARMMNEQIDKHRGKAVDNEAYTKPILNNEIDKMRDMLQKSLGMHSVVKLSRSSRQTKVYITLKGSPDQTEDNLKRILKIAEEGGAS